MHRTLPGFPKVVAFRSTTCLAEVMDFGAESSGTTRGRPYFRISRFCYDANQPTMCF
jgi:hypothetical protein